MLSFPRGSHLHSMSKVLADDESLPSAGLLFFYCCDIFAFQLLLLSFPIGNILHQLQRITRPSSKQPLHSMSQMLHNVCSIISSLSASLHCRLIAYVCLSYRMNVREQPRNAQNAGKGQTDKEEGNKGGESAIVWFVVDSSFRCSAEEEA